jgi:hypothetical protein
VPGRYILFVFSGELNFIKLKNPFTISLQGLSLRNKLAWPLMIKNQFLKTIYILALLLFSQANVKAQATRGVVLESITNKPIPFASVYIENSSVATTADAKGNFKLNIRGIDSQIPLTVSAIGYFSEKIYQYQNDEIRVFLKPKLTNLKEVTINLNDEMSRQEKLNRFRQAFLGTTNNAKNCVILNEKDIRLVYIREKSTLKAFCDTPLIILNKDLGYTVTYFLNEFTHTPLSVYFEGNYYFKEDSLANTNYLRKRRERSYAGSRMHFIRSLWSNTLAENKFEIFNWAGQPLTYNDLILVVKGRKYLQPREYLSIKYDKRFTSSVMPRKQATYLGKNGYHDSNILWHGELAVKRIADLLPFEFLASHEKEPVENGIPDSIMHEFTALSAQLDTFKNHFPREKLFVHIDQSSYLTRDTLWFKAYLLDANTAGPSLKSGTLYTELISDSGKVVNRIPSRIENGIAYGQIPLGNSGVSEGIYTLRAYTQWMQNFGEECFYQKDIYIINPLNKQWMVREQHRLVDNDRVLQFELNLTDPSGRPVQQEVAWQLVDGKKTLAGGLGKNEKGRLNGQVTLPVKTSKQLTLKVTGKEPGKTNLTVPFKLKSEKEIDLQFMPEGGYLVAGLPCKIGFKALNPDGRGISLQGVIVNSKQEELVQFKTLHKGMGAFELVPQLAETYSARVTMADGREVTYPLPQVRDFGTVLRVNNLLSDDSLSVTILTSPQVLQGQQYRLVGLGNSEVKFGASLKLSTPRIRIKIPKQNFPTGIAHFTLFNEKNQPLNERIAFIDHRDKLNISIDSLKPSYSTYDSIPLHIKVTDEFGSPVTGEFSMAVLDDLNTAIDPFGENICTRMLLTSDLKGDVESPNYYFSGSANAALALDHLMLTQGWTAYNWEKIFANPESPKYPADTAFTLSGSVTNAFNKPMSNSKVFALIITPKKTLVKDTLTNSAGVFSFKNLIYQDTVTFVVNGKNARNKNVRGEVNINKFTPAAINLAKYQYPRPWYVNSDSTLLYFSSARSKAYIDRENRLAGNLLQEISIVGRRTVRNSHNLNGPGEADQVIDENLVRKRGDINLLQLLTQTVKGFTTQYSQRTPYYAVDHKRITFVIDGVPLDFLFDAAMSNLPSDYFYFVGSVLKEIDGSEILGIEVMYNSQYTEKYVSTYGSSNTSASRIAFIEITTRQGKGPFMASSSGIAIYKPTPLVRPLSFYRPRYRSKPTSEHQDFRSTIHWQPDVITSTKGTSFTSFYAGGQPGTYTVIIQGTSMKGEFGYQLLKLKIDK